MPELVLGESEQRALRALMALDPVPGAPMPSRRFLELLTTLIPGDAIGACVVHNSGRSDGSVELPNGYYDRYVEELDHSGPLILGTIHWSRRPREAEACQAILPQHVDGLTVGFRSGPDAVAQVFWDRRKRLFDERDLAMLDLVLPVLQRHLRQPATTRLPGNLTVQERNVLMEVAAGSSNAEIAEALCIAQGTVRKHLEHAFRKLGVTNRLAAVVALEGRRPLRDDRRSEIARYA